MPAAKKSSSLRASVSKKGSAKSAGKKPAKIKLTQASAREIRAALGIKPSEIRAAKRAIQRASQASKARSVANRAKRSASKGSPAGRGAKKQS